MAYGPLSFIKYFPMPLGLTSCDSVQMQKMLDRFLYIVMGADDHTKPKVACDAPKHEAAKSVHPRWLRHTNDALTHAPTPTPFLVPKRCGRYNQSEVAGQVNDSVGEHPRGCRDSCDDAQERTMLPLWSSNM